jgi:threonine dehydratase
MSLSIKAGHVVSDPNAKSTLSDGSAGPLEEDSITFDICRNLISRFILIEENEIEQAIRYVWKQHEMVIEGAAAVAVAAAKNDTLRTAQDNAVVILCGGNIDEGTHLQICKG